VENLLLDIPALTGDDSKKKNAAADYDQPLGLR
jgi:hypothetical protein